MSLLDEAIIATFDSNTQLRWDLSSGNEVAAIRPKAEVDPATSNLNCVL